jgi:uncharacterized membrane protein
MLAIMVIFFIFNKNLEDSNNLNYYFFQNILMYLALLTSVMSGIIYFVKYNIGTNSQVK